jgi:hypothetical protein
MQDQLRTDEEIIRRELCKIRYRGMKEMCPAPLPGMSEKGWIQKSGELILTKKQLVFIEKHGCLIPSRPKIIFSAPLQGLSTSILKFALTKDQLEVVIGTSAAQFGVSDPESWAFHIEQYSSKC